MVGRARLELRATGFTFCCGIVAEPVLELYGRLGLHLEVLAGPRRVWGEDRVPVRFGSL